MRGLCREDADAASQIAAWALMPVFVLEALFHWGGPLPELVMIPAINAVICAVSAWWLQSLRGRHQYPELLLLLLWSLVQIANLGHLYFPTAGAEFSTLIFFAVSMVVSAALFMPLIVMLVTVLGSLTGYLVTFSFLPETNTLSGLAVPFLLLFISAVVHLVRRNAIRQAEISRVLASRVHDQNLELVTAKRVHDAAMTLAGGVAHHFNNKLQVIMFALENALVSIGPSHEVSRSLALGLKSSESLLVLVSNLQAYSGNLPMHPVPVSVAQLLDVDQLRSSTPPDQRLHFAAPEIAAEVMVDKVMLGRAVQELIKNAVESGNEGGDLHLRVTTDTTHCRISLADSGAGFRNIPTSSAAVPFVTTDPISHGGLGLSFVYGVTERHGGSLRIEDSEGGGSVVSILLPLIPR